MVVVLRKEVEFNRLTFIKMKLDFVNNGLHFLSVIAAATN